MFSLARALFSPGSAEDRSSLFVWLIDRMARSDSSRACAGSSTTQDRLLAIIANQRGVFLHQERVGILILRFSKLNTRRTLINALTVTLVL